MSDYKRRLRIAYTATVEDLLVFVIFLSTYSKISSIYEFDELLVLVPVLLLLRFIDFVFELVANLFSDIKSSSHFFYRSSASFNL